MALRRTAGRMAVSYTAMSTLAWWWWWGGGSAAWWAHDLSVNPDYRRKQRLDYITRRVDHGYSRNAKMLLVHSFISVELKFSGKVMFNIIEVQS